MPIPLKKVKVIQSLIILVTDKESHQSILLPYTANHENRILQSSKTDAEILLYLNIRCKKNDTDKKQVNAAGNGRM